MVSRFIKSLHDVFRTNSDEISTDNLKTVENAPDKESTPNEKPNLYPGQIISKIPIESRKDDSSPTNSPQLSDESSTVEEDESSQKMLPTPRIYTRMNHLRGETLQPLPLDSKQKEEDRINNNVTEEIPEDFEYELETREYELETTEDEDNDRMAKSIANKLAQIPCRGQPFTKQMSQINLLKERQSQSQELVQKRSSSRIFYNVTKMSQPHQVRPTTTPESFKARGLKETVSVGDNSHSFAYRVDVQSTTLSPLKGPPQEAFYSSLNSSLSNESVDLDSESIDQIETIIRSIISDEGVDFQEKYSEWIARVFHDKLEKMRYKLTLQYNKKIAKLSSESEKDVQNLHAFYQNKLEEFQKTSEDFQELITNLKCESTLIQERKDETIEKLRNEVKNGETILAKELDNQRTILEREFEIEKLELITDYETNLKKVLKSITNIKLNSVPDAALNLQLDHANDLSVQLMQEYSKTRKDFQSSDGAQMEILTEKITELQNIINVIQQEKVGLMRAKEESSLSIQKNGQRALAALTRQLDKSSLTIQNMKKKHDREIKDLKMEMLNKETNYNRNFVEMKRKYGNKIEELGSMLNSIEAKIIN